MKNKWSEITVNEFIQLEQILKSEIPESYRTVTVVALLSNQTVDEIEDLPASSFTKLARDLKFIEDKPKDRKVKSSYKLNGRSYQLHADITKISTAQYIDYQNYMKEEEKDMTKILSCWMIPKGHKYNDGYDMQQVINDCGDMLLEDALGIAFFFAKQSAAYILILKEYLSKNLKTLEIDKKKIEELETHLNSMAYYHWCLPYAEKPTLRWNMY